MEVGWTKKGQEKGRGPGGGGGAAVKAQVKSKTKSNSNGSHKKCRKVNCYWRLAEDPFFRWEKWSEVIVFFQKKKGGGV